MVDGSGGWNMCKYCYTSPAIIELIDKADNTAIRLLRCSDVSPANVIADLYLLHEKRCDISYKGSFVANLIAYAALNKFLKYARGDKYTIKNEWERDYVVMSKPDYSNVSYIYTVSIYYGKVTLTVKERSTLRDDWEVIFEGSLEEAYEKFCKETRYENGAHVDPRLFDFVKLMDVL